MAIVKFNIQLERAEMIAPQVKHLAFKRSDGEPFPFIPGQFITIHFEAEGRTLRRSYSVASIPSQTDLIEIAAGYVDDGPGTELLFELEPGDEITIAGPFGRLVLRDAEKPKRYVFVATSTGVTPFRAMLPELEKRIREDDVKIVQLLGVQTRADLIYGNEFAAFAEQHANYEFRAQYSRETTTDLANYEHCGYVQTTFAGLNLNPEEDIVYLCGNPGMIDAAFEDLQQRGFTPQQVRREKYISSK